MYKFVEAELGIKNRGTVLKLFVRLVLVLVYILALPYALIRNRREVVGVIRAWWNLKKMLRKAKVK